MSLGAPAETVEAFAREHARAEYDLTEEEVETLADAEEFAEAAYLRRAVLDAIPEPHIDPENPRGVEDLTPREVALIREGTVLVGVLSRKCDDRAAEALGEFPEPLDFGDRLARHTEGGVQGGETA